jgi:hypothetical protein
MRPVWWSTTRTGSTVFHSEVYCSSSGYVRFQVAPESVERAIEFSVFAGENSTVPFGVTAMFVSEVGKSIGPAQAARPATALFTTDPPWRWLTTGPLNAHSSPVPAPSATAWPPQASTPAINAPLTRMARIRSDRRSVR